MRPSAIVLTGFFLAALLLSSCGPTPTATPLPTEHLEETATAPPAGLPTATALAQPPTPWPLLPTATPYAPPEAQPGVFANADLGVTLRYPQGWDIDEDTGEEAVLALFYSPYSLVIGGLFSVQLESDQTLPEAARSMRDFVLGTGVTITVLSDQATRLDDGREAWATLATFTAPGDPTEIKANLTTTIYGARVFTLAILALPADYDSYQQDIAAIVGALHVEAPSLYGISRDQALVLAGGENTNPRENDPATAHTSSDKRVFSGLVSFDPHLNVVPELAESWQVANGTVYTFTIRPNARFHNGRPVTTQDVIYSWERALDPKTESDTALTYLGDIVGSQEMADGKAEHVAGLKAIDDRTLQVTIDAPKPYFLLKLTYAAAFVLDRQNVESGPEWYRHPNGTGPYVLVRWDSFKLKLYQRNEDYYLGPPAIPYVVVRLYAGVAMRLYESDEVDVAGVGSNNVQRVLDPKEPLHAELVTAVDMCTSYIVFDIAQPPFDDPLVRQAFTMAFDRQQYIDVVLQGTALPAVGPYPPALPGYNADLQGLPYDPARARELLAQSKYAGPAGLPPIVYTDSGIGSWIASDVAAVAQMWQQNLGITITVENLEPDKYWDEIYAGHHGQLFSAGWCADYPDPENFADILFHSGSQQNRGHYSNPQLDALLDQARVEQDTARRIQLYQQGERIIVDDAPVLFTTHALSYVLVKPYVRGYVLTPIDIPLERYLSISKTSMK